LGQVISQDNLILHRRNWKGNGQCVVFVIGCFDLVHPGHIRLLEQARSYGDILIVGVVSDASVRALNLPVRLARPKGGEPVRPITSAGERAEILAALAAVDYAVEVESPSASGLIARLSPEILVQGAPSIPNAGESNEDRAAVACGAKIVRIHLEPGFSTTQLIERIIQPRA
jgi:rfaE bifunctional protein nucleotidyltransferase chain/domain